MSLSEYWNIFGKIQDLNSISMMCVIVGFICIFLYMMIGILGFEKISKLFLKLFIALEICSAVLMLVSSIWFSKLSYDWNNQQTASSIIIRVK